MAKAKPEAAPKIWKPYPEEFILSVDHQAIADQLGVAIEQVEFDGGDEEQDGVAGHYLTGSIKPTTLE